MKMNNKVIKNFPSIFNDVIGPVMRGPSSSHCAASVRIGKLARDLMGGSFEEIVIDFDPNGSLATTHESQGSDMGLFGGFLGWDATDERLPHSPVAIKEAGINITISIVSYGAVHPNTYRMSFKNSSESRRMTTISTGGGMIEIIEIDGVAVSIAGDYYETLIYLDSDPDLILEYLRNRIQADEISHVKGEKTQFIKIKAQSFLDEKIVKNLKANFNVNSIKELKPVLPILSRKGMSVPFITAHEMMQFNQNNNLELWELAVEYESARGNLSAEEVFSKMKELVLIMQNSINEGIKGTEYADRILGYQSGNFKKMMEADKLLDGGMLNRMVLYVTSIMEVKSSMGVIIAAPTAGACAALPGACIAAAEAMGMSLDDTTKALLAAGIIGVFIAAHAHGSAKYDWGYL
jgi:L-serine dehydratase